MSSSPRSTHTLRATAIAVLVGSALGMFVAGSPVQGTTGDAQPSTPWESSTRTVREAGRGAQRTAYDLLGDRPFQAVLMSGEHPVMTASSPGSTPFSDVQLASISKLVTSMTVMRLVELGRLSLADTLGDVFAPALVPERWRDVTFDQLLAHMSGFAADRDRWFNDTYPSCFDAFRRTVQRDAPAAVGYEYSNTNFCALSLAIGRVSGPSYEDAAYRLVLRPLGIDRKVMDQDYGNLAGAGGWRMSALDIARVVAALDPEARLSPVTSTTRSQMIQQTTYNYGRGVWIWDAETFGHSGSLYRARNIAVRLPSGRVVVILTQATFPDSGLDLLPIAQRIDAAYAESCVQDPCSFAGLDPFNGVPTGILGRNVL